MERTDCTFESRHGSDPMTMMEVIVVMKDLDLMGVNLMEGDLPKVILIPRLLCPLGSFII